MSCQVYYRKWRPQSLAEVVGQKPITDTLLSALRQQRVAQAYLFCGPRGTGKTSTGRILAKAINCLNNNGTGEPCNTCEMCRAITENGAMDVIEIDAASNTGVDDIRDLKERVNYSPAQARFKIYIIDEVHMLSTSASNALLKTLEEPPPQVIFILATTELHKILPTIMSRCQRFDFRRLSTVDIADKLSDIAKAEGVTIDSDGITLLARSSGGSLRDAENLLQQVATVYDGRINLKQVRESLGLTGDDRSALLVKYITGADTTAGMKLLSEVAADGVDLKQFNRELIEKLRQLLMVKAGSISSLGLTTEELAEAETSAASTTTEYILGALKNFTALLSNTDMSSPLAMEMAFINTTIKPLSTPSQPRDFTPRHSPSVDSASGKPAGNKVGKPSRLQPHVQVESVNKPEPVTEAPQAAPREKTAVSPPETGRGADEKMTTDGPVENLEQLVDCWPQILSGSPPQLRRSPALAILRSAGVRPVAFENGVLTLSFKFPIHMNKINEPDNKRVTTEILTACLGTPCQVSCIYEQPSNHLVKEAQKHGAEIINVEDKWTSQK